MDHLDDILAIGKGRELPQDAEVTSVSPATNFGDAILLLERPLGRGWLIIRDSTR